MKHTYFRGFLGLLVLVIIFNSCIITVGANDTIIADDTATIKKIETEVYSLLQELNLIPTNDDVVEIVSLREQNVKHFKLSDGTYQAIVFPYPVHELDQNGSWKTIDVKALSENGSSTRTGINVMDPIYDTYISSTYPNNRYGSASYVRVGRNEIAFFEFGIPYIPAFATITSANLNVSYSLDVSGGSVGCYVYQVLQPWTPHNLDWTEASRYENMGLSSSYLSIVTFRDTNGETLTNPPRGTIDVTDAVVSWIESDNEDNYGVALKRFGGMSSHVDFSAMDGDIYRRPYVTINYDISENDSKTHYIQNVATGKYIDIEGPSKLEGAIIQQWQFNAKPQSRWYLSFESDGYFTLKSEYSNMYIGVDSTNSSVVKQYSTISDYTKWKAIKTASGNCKLVCKGIESSGMVLATPSDASGNGANLTMTTYVNDSNYKDEWAFWALYYSAVANNYYDEGQRVRFGDAGVSNIADAQKTVSELFAMLFELKIVINTPAYYETLPDVCKGTVDSANLDTMCSNEDHLWTTVTRSVKNDNNEIVQVTFNCYCTDRSSYIQENTLVGSNTLTNIVWTGHRVRSYSSKGTINYNRSCSSGYLILMLNKDANTRVLAHELSHQYGAGDHYCEMLANDECKFAGKCNNEDHTPNSNLRRDGWCLMDNDGSDGVPSWSDLSSRDLDEIFCPACLNDILSHLNLHH